MDVGNAFVGRLSSSIIKFQYPRRTLRRTYSLITWYITLKPHMMAINSAHLHATALSFLKGVEVLVLY